MDSHFLSDWWPAPSSPRQTSRLRQELLLAGFSTAHEILALSNAFLKSRLPKHLGISDAQLDAVRTELASWVASGVACSSSSLPAAAPSETEYDVRQARTELLLSTGEPEIDNLLRGGLRVGVTELVGEASSGKTQLCLQLCLQVQRHPNQGGLGASAYYMASEATFPTRRALQIAQTRYSLTDEAAKAMLHHIHLTPAESFDDLQHFALVWSRGLAKQQQQQPSGAKPLGLLVIDSLAAPVRTEYTNDTVGWRQRGHDLNVFGERLKQLAHDLQLCVVVVNQVSEVTTSNQGMRQQHAAFRADEQLSPSPSSSSSFSRVLELPYAAAASTFASHPLAKTKQASLGLVWANQVDVRLCLLKSNRRSMAASAGQSLRHLCVVYSPLSPSSGPSSYVDYTIQPRGVTVHKPSFFGLVKRLQHLPSNDSAQSTSTSAWLLDSSGTAAASLASSQSAAGQDSSLDVLEEEEERMWQMLDGADDRTLEDIDMETF